MSELRSVDINPLEPLGVNETQLRFWKRSCCFACSTNRRRSTRRERAIDDNQMAVALTGRDPALVLRRRRDPALPLRRWAEQIFGLLQPICALLDLGETANPCHGTGRTARDLGGAGAYPSARIVATMRASGETSSVMPGGCQEQHRHHFESRPLAESGYGFSPRQPSVRCGTGRDRSGGRDFVR